MDIIQNIYTSINNSGLTLTDIERKCGFSKSSMRKWSEHFPTIDKVLKVSNVLNMPMDTLLFGKEKNSPTVNLTADEQELLAYYKDLTEKEKGIVYGNAQALSKAHIIPFEETKNTIFIEYYDLPVSAGTGVYLDSCDKDMIEVDENQLTVQANFALRVSGDSMEPAYHNGDTILVKSQPAVDVGEIGIFILNGCGYIKEFGGDCLISLNPKYENMKLTEDDSFYCRGKVIGTL